MRDPFTVLGVAEDADDAEIRRRYLALVRDFPPDRDPDRFREYRAAYDALSDERGSRLTLIWMLPSSNGGRKSAPSRVNPSTARPTPSQLNSSRLPARAMLKRIR